MNLFSEEATQEAIDFLDLPEDGIVVGKSVYKWREIPYGRLDNYLSVDFRAEPLRFPLYKNENGLWMSLTPMEVQSAWVGIQRAAYHEKIALCGLGLGYHALAIADNDAHQYIHIYEKDAECVTAFHKMFQHRNGFDKFRFIIGDCRETMIDQEYDYAFVDIYQNLMDSKIADDISYFMANNFIGEYRYWCQEAVVLHTDEDYLEEVRIELREQNIWTPEDAHMLMMFRDSEQSRLKSPFSYCDEDFCREILETHLLCQV